MKKILSLIIALIMVSSAAAFIVPVAGTSAVHTLDENNVAIDVPYFSGTTNLVAITGALTKPKTFEDMGSINISDKTGSGVLNLDGTITEEEWGLPIIDVTTDCAATFKGTEPSAENTYFWHVSQEKDNNGEWVWPRKYNPDGVFSYKVWMASGS